MAKEKNTKEKGSKGIGILIAVLIIITWLSVMALLIKCDVGGFGSEVLRPVFKNIPVINAILPDASDEEVARESDYPYDNLADALAQIAVLDNSVASKEAEIAALNDKVAEQEAEITRLSGIVEDQKEFEEKKNKFYDEIVYGDSAPDADTYVEWYNQLDAEHAEEVYREIISAQQADQDIVDLAAAYSSMDAKKAASILESMKTDMDTVALIMNNMDSESQGKILAEMDPDFAASVTKKLLP
ncbi:MAG: MotE family protein [Wujia sp.]